MNPKSEVLIAAVLVVLLACVQCQVSGKRERERGQLSLMQSILQLTFSPDWGKRSGGVSGGVNGAGGFFEPQQGNCKTSNEMLLEIFRFVQSQAQLFLDCKHRE
ncbi:hypothetical protein KR222_009409 [Zaprionus bogoriensis]|nr:hypothetical protein KR222_009409 [Zaprionus bogoriensis]